MKIKRGFVEVELTLRDMIAYLEEDLQTDPHYVKDRFNQVFGVDLPLDEEFDLILEKDFIKLTFPEKEE